MIDESSTPAGEYRNFEGIDRVPPEQKIHLRAVPASIPGAERDGMIDESSTPARQAPSWVMVPSSW
jgi:hypothetical protein